MSKLIDNTKAWSGFCTTCDNKGIIRVPSPEDEDKYDELCDKYESQYPPEKCRELALDRCNCEMFYCPKCEKGLKYANKYMRYNGK